MKIIQLIRVTALCILALFAMNAQAEGDVVFNEGTITGSVRIGSEQLVRVTIIAKSGSLESRQTFDVGSDPTVINYSLPVNVPVGGTQRYRVYAYALQLAGGNRVDFYSHYLDVADGASVRADFVIDNPGYIEGDVIINNAELSSAILYFRGNSIAYRAPTSKAKNNHYRLAVQAGDNALQSNTEIRLTDGRKLTPFTNQPVAVVAGETTNFDVTYNAPVPAVVQGNIDMPGPLTPTRHNCQLIGPGINHGKTAPCTYEVGAGLYILRALTYYDNVNDRFYHPYSSYASGTNRATVAEGETYIFNVSSPQSFINGTLNFTGAATNADLNSGTVFARGITGTPTEGGESGDYASGDGVFDLVVSPGDWDISQFNLGFLRDDPADYLLSYMNSLRLWSSEIINVHVEAGETVDLGALNMELGGVTVNFRAEGGATFSNPFFIGNCAKWDDSGNLLHSYAISSANPTVVDATNAQVSLVGLSATCNNVRAYATVNGARVTFGTFSVTVDPGVTKTVDLGAPELDVQTPEPNIITSNASITVSGKAMDDVGVTSITVNGSTASIQSTNNPDDANEVSFSVPVALARGPNTIVTVASDDAGKQATDTRTVYRDEALPTLSFTPLDGAITTEFTAQVEGIADDDAGVASVKVNGTAVAITSTANMAAPNEVSFSVPQTLVLGENTISVTVTDISHRTTTVVHKVTVVENRPPVADAGADISLACTSTTSTNVTLDGSGSTDPDGDVLTYGWVGSFGSATGIAPTVSLPLGSSDITLTVNDGVFSDTDSLTVMVNVGVNGLLPPLVALVEEGNEPVAPDKAFKHGRVLPLKLELGCSGATLGDADIAAPTIVSITPQGATPIDLTVVDPDAGEANDNGLLFRYSDPQWIYNLNTRDLMPGTVYDVTIRMPDGRNLVSRFALR